MFSKLYYEVFFRLRPELAIELLDTSVIEYLRLYDLLKNDLPMESNKDFWIKTLKDLQKFHLENSGWELEELFN
jgi:hypothetical protein